MVLTFSVPFVQGKGRPRFARMKKGVRAFTPKSTEQAEKAMRDAYRGECVRRFGHVVTAPAHTPVAVFVVTRRALPKSRPKRVIREHDTFKPDLDNICKSVLDALNNEAWEDDNQVSQLHAYKLPRLRGVFDRTYVTVIWED